ncbi:MAG: hypothetical protein IKL14_01655 [Alphaproteobacteria bacterium]|nr:hypothetical protein [Alphaproteobacteria bacterium]
MNKSRILTFLSTSAAVFAFAGGAAFAAADGGDPVAVVYGTYNPTCTKFTDDITVNFFGYTSAGTFGKVYSTTISRSSNNWASGATLTTLAAPVAKPVTVGSVSYTKGVTPRGAVLYSVGGSEPTAVDYSSNAGLIVGATTAVWDVDSMVTADDTGLAEDMSFGFGAGGTFPTIPTDLFDTVGESNTLVLNYIIPYAASCLDVDHGECTLTIGVQQGSTKYPGAAVYHNSCDDGYSGSNFGGSTLACGTAGSCGDIQASVQGAAPSQSTTPNYANAN